MDLYVSGQKLAIPPICACCGVRSETELPAAATRHTGVRVRRVQTRWWNFEYCHRCAAHLMAWPPDFSGSDTILTLITCGLYLIHFFSNSTSAKQRAQSMMYSSCTGPLMPVRFLGWNGSMLHFDFASPYYAGEFMKLNASKLVNLNPAQRDWLRNVLR